MGDESIEATDGDGLTALMRAAYGLDNDSVELLLRAGADPNRTDVKGRTAIMLALVNGRLDSLPPLIAGGADPNLRDVWGNNALGYAYGSNMGSAQKRDLAVHLIREAGGREDHARHGLFSGSVVYGEIGLSRRLITEGQDINAYGPNGWRALVTAASLKRNETAAMLLQAGANVNLADADERTPLIAAASDGNLELVKRFIEAGADPLAIGESGRPKTTALYYAKLHYKSEEVVEYLTATEAACRATVASVGPYANKRGIENTEVNSQQLLVKFPIEQVGNAFEQLTGSQARVRNVLGQRATLTIRCFLILQLKRHPWTVIAGLTEDTGYAPLEQWALQLSQILKTQAMFYYCSNDPIALHYGFFDQGRSGAALDYATEGAMADLDFAAKRGNVIAQARLKALRDRDGTVATAVSGRASRTKSAEKFTEVLFKQLDLFVPAIETGQMPVGGEVLLSVPHIGVDELKGLELLREVALRS